MAALTATHVQPSMARGAAAAVTQSPVLHCLPPLCVLRRQVMKESKGRVNPGLMQKMLLDKLKA